MRHGQSASVRRYLSQGGPGARDRHGLWRQRCHRQLQVHQAGRGPGLDGARRLAAGHGRPAGGVPARCAPGWTRRPRGPSWRYPVFDGRKRYDASLRYLGLDPVADDSGSAPAHRVAVRYTGGPGPERGHRQAGAGARTPRASSSSRSAPTAATCRCASRARWTACRSRPNWPPTVLRQGCRCKPSRAGQAAAFAAMPFSVSSC